MNWEVILWTCITVAFLLIVFGLIISLISAVNVRKKMKTLGNVHEVMKVGSKVMISGGIYGKVTGIDDDTVSVEIARGVVVKASRYSVSDVVSE